MTTYTFRVLGLLAVLTILANPVGGADVPRVQVSRVPDAGVFPQAQLGADGTVHLIYFKGDAMGGDILYIRSKDAGATFSPALRVNSQPGSVVLAGTVRGPQMAVGKGGRVHVAWMGSKDAQPRVEDKGAPMLYARMTDSGDSFEPQRNVIQEHHGLDGGGSVAADEEGNVYVAWHAPRLERTEADRQIWLVRSKDEGRTFGPELVANPKPVGVCACCGMKVLAGPKGTLYILYRSAREMVNRDMYLLASKDYGGTFEIVATHPWKVGACVMSTSAFAVGKQGVLAAWETQQQIFVLPRVGSGAQPIAPPGEGKNRKHPSLAANDREEFVLSWTEETAWKKGGVVAWQHFDHKGRAVGEPGRAEGLPVWGVPAVLPVPDGSFRVIY